MTDREQEIREAIAEIELDPDMAGVLDTYYSPVVQEETKKFMLEVIDLLDNAETDPAMKFLLDYEPLASGIAGMVGPYSKAADLDPAGMKTLVGLIQAVQATTVCALRRM